MLNPAHRLLSRRRCVKNPSQVTSLPLEFWYRADDYEESGGDLTQLNDKSGNARHLTVAAGLPVIAATGGPNATPVVQFDGNDALRSASFTAVPQPFQVFAVASWNTWTHGEKLADFHTGTCDLQQRTSSPNVSQSGGSLSTSLVPMTLSTFFVLDGLFDGSDSHMRLNLGTKVTGGGDIGSNGINRICLGAANTLTDLGDCNIAEIFAFSGGDLADPELTCLKNYLNGRYGLIPES